MSIFRKSEPKPETGQKRRKFHPIRKTLKVASLIGIGAVGANYLRDGNSQSLKYNK